MQSFGKIILVAVFSLISITTFSSASVQSIEFIKFESFKETIQSNIIKKNNLSDVNSANLDFVRANDKQLKIIRNEIKFSSYNEEKFINSYTRLNEIFTEISFDIYQESKFYLITNNVMTPGLDTKLRRISTNYINEFYGLPSISISMPIENSKYLPIEGPTMTAATAVPAVGLSTAAIVSVLGLGAAAGGGGGGSGGVGLPSIILTSNKTEIYDSDTSGVTITATASSASTKIITVNLENTGTATFGVDYNGPTSIVISAGSTSSAATFIPVADNDYEGTETAVVGISSVTNGTESGAQSISINLKEYSLNLKPTDFVYNVGTQKETDFENLAEYIQVGAANPASWSHPYGVHNIHKAWAYHDAANNKYLSGEGETVYIFDGGFDRNHAEFISKYNAGDLTEFIAAGRSGIGVATSGSFHGNAVASLAAGKNDSSGMMGVAYNAKIRWAAKWEYPTTGITAESDWSTQVAEDGIIAQPAAQNNSWGIALTTYGCNNSNISGSFDWCVANGLINASDTWPLNSVNVDDLEAYKTGFSLSTSEAFAIMQNGSSSSADVQSWDGWIDALDRLQNTTIIVFALGNVSSETESQSYAALPHFYSQLGEAFLGVGWADVKGSSISPSTVIRGGNPCGSAKTHCIFASGWTVNAMHVDGAGDSKYSHGAGSSYSSPITSGAIALLAQAFPNHTPAAIQERILVTANNSFFTPTDQMTFTNGIQHGYNAEWGHGLLDVDRALKPVLTSYNGLGGSLAVYLGEDLAHQKGYGAHETYFTFTNSFGSPSIMSKISDEYTFVYDALYGGFPVRVVNFFNFTEKKLKTSDLVTYELANADRLFQQGNSNNFNPINFINSSSDNEDQIKFGFILDNQNLSIQKFNHKRKNNFSYLTSNNPLLNNNKGGLGFSSKIKIGNDELIFGFQDSSLKSSINEEFDENIKAQTISASYSYSNSFLDDLTLLSGLVIEKGSILDSKGSGAFSLNESNSRSYLSGINVKKNISSDTSINFSSILARTSFENLDNNLISSFNSISSSSFDFYLEKNNLFFDDDVFSFTISQPHRIESGEMRIMIPNLADKYGNLTYRYSDLDLNPNGRQIDIGIGYSRKINDNFMFNIKSIHIKNRNHDSNKNLDHLALFNASVKF